MSDTTIAAQSRTVGKQDTLFILIALIKWVDWLNATKTAAAK